MQPSRISNWKLKTQTGASGNSRTNGIAVTLEKKKREEKQYSDKHTEEVDGCVITKITQDLVDSWIRHLLNKKSPGVVLKSVPLDKCCQLLAFITGLTPNPTATTGVILSWE